MWQKAIIIDDDFENENGLPVFDERFCKPVIRLGDPNLLLQYVDEAAVGGSQLEYFTPNGVSLHLAISRKSASAASLLLDEINMSAAIKEKHASSFNRPVLIADSKTVCDYLEQIQTAIVFSFTAVEAFANISIPSDYEYSKAGNRCMEIYDKPQIERYVNWKIKLSEILVEVYNTASIITQSFWPEFCELAKIRDSIIHQKSMNDTSHYRQLFHKRVLRLCKSASSLIGFFIDSTSTLDNEMSGNERRWPLLTEKGAIVGASSTLEVSREKPKD